tara:strand:+ start:1201 stop:1473 length:273 start_codon:yes stop_codon:yes gene_type:complete
MFNYEFNFSFKYMSCESNSIAFKFRYLGITGIGVATHFDLSDSVVSSIEFDNPKFEFVIDNHLYEEKISTEEFISSVLKTVIKNIHEISK